MSDPFGLTGKFERTSRFGRGARRCTMKNHRNQRLVTALFLSLTLGPQIGLAQEGYTVATERPLVDEAQAHPAAAYQDTPRLAEKGPRIRGIFVPSPGIVQTFSRAAAFQRAPICDFLSTVVARESTSLGFRIERQNERECTIEVTSRQSPASRNEFLFIQVRAEADLVSSLRFKLVLSLIHI